MLPAGIFATRDGDVHGAQIPDDTHGDQTPDGDIRGAQIRDGTHGDETLDGTRHDHTHPEGHHIVYHHHSHQEDALDVEPAVMIAAAAAAAKPMTVLRIVLTPLFADAFWGYRAVSDVAGRQNDHPRAA
jgi:hypothetical protein